MTIGSSHNPWGWVNQGKKLELSELLITEGKNFKTPETIHLRRELYVAVAVISGAQRKDLVELRLRMLREVAACMILVHLRWYD